MNILTGRLYDKMWLWFELGELCKVLAWPGLGAFGLYALWTYCVQDPRVVAKIFIAAAACGATQLLLQAGIRLSAVMVARTIREIDEILFGRIDT